MSMSIFRMYLSAVRKSACHRLAAAFTPCSCLHTSATSISDWKWKNYFLRKSGLHIGENVGIDSGFYALPFSEGQISIDDHTIIGQNCKVYAFNTVSIGKFNMFAADVTIANGWHDKDTFEPSSGKLSIGSGCWIGNGARLIGAITVGDNAIIGAGAVVVEDVPENAIVTGVSAKRIGFRTLPKKVWHLNNTYFCPRTFTLVE